ncbi:MULTISPECIES: triacylglycerol lipase [unclassified Candidatus Cardinium]|uniref:esterase/lipase family protein n=1 Tax=unclassified Candidatus Cardinium TaxID=2641185 RepID=UPI001FB23A22|nr:MULTISPECIES: hypothetical protein [unclassified Candidatus Cardinium]
MYKAILGQQPTFAALLLHGLYGHANELKPIAERLQNAFGKSVLIIQPTCRVRLKSVIRSIDQQAEDIGKYIAVTLIEYGKEPSSFPLIIIGYSQGGLLACTLAQSYNNQLNILGIITLNAPLMGTPFLERSSKDVQDFISDAKKGLQLIDYPLSRIKWSMTLQRWMRIVARPGWIPLDGLKDLLPNSPCTKNAYNFLQKNQKIPCLLIATYENDFSELFNMHIQIAEQKRAIELLNDAYALFITGKKEGKHDTLIPLASQLGRQDWLHKEVAIDAKHPPYSQLSIIAPNPIQIKRRMYKGIIHASNLVAIDPRLFVDHGEMVIYTEVILIDLIQFIKQLLQVSCK